MTQPAVHPADRLMQAIDSIGSPVCVGLDPVAEKMPAALAGKPIATALAEFGMGIIRAVSGIVPCVKIQSACYERFGPDGMKALAQTLEVARECGLVTILDGKRGDIGISAEHYAAAIYGQYRADWATVNSYLGMDGIVPFLGHGGAFALVRTSNPGSDALQSLRTAAGPTVSETVADLVAHAGRSTIGACGYSALGAVVGATKSHEAAALRARMPQQIFLVPGFGAQGGTVADILPCFHQDGRGALVTASRSVIFAAASDPCDWTSPIQRAATAFAHEVRLGIQRAAPSPARQA
ncbi:MAG: orotidine-5'-phosphate decarboxylase [Phycisphaerales bacterium]|nr:orotidine-5'-phosphate decarboxylase [Phycisphaerales bacterium]